VDQSGSEWVRVGQSGSEWVRVGQSGSEHGLVQPFSLGKSHNLVKRFTRFKTV